MREGKSAPTRVFNVPKLNERFVEVPLALAVTRRYRGKRVLEVGNVLGHYARRWWACIDRYERAQGVLNVDVLAWKPRDLFDLIVSVSTFEHVRYDEPERVPGATVVAIERCVTWLVPGGLLLATLPIGYNAESDLMLARDALEGASVRYMRRVALPNRWGACSKGEALGLAYDFGFPRANAIAIVEIARKVGK